MKKAILLFLTCAQFANVAQAQKTPLDQMTLLGTFSAGQPGVTIYKMYDRTEDVICYLLMPDVAAKRALENGAWVYEANAVGAISCMKAKALPTISNHTKK